MKKVAIIGYGWVGKAMHKLFPDALIRDPIMKNPPPASKKEVNQCDVAFICVPTPLKEVIDGAGAEIRYDEGLDTSIVEEVVEWCEAPLLVIRSTVNPGDCDRWTIKYKKNICVQPEYLGETIEHPFSDPRARRFLVVGGELENRKKLIELYKSVYNANINIRQVTNYEAEVIKLSENRAVSFKVAQCQELYDTCEMAGVDYNIVREIIYGDDLRFTLWWTFVYAENRGFNSKCIPKDVYAWCAWAESVGYNPIITKKLLEKNKEWIKK